MRGSSTDFYKIILKSQEEPINELIADMLCELEAGLEHEHIPRNFENVLDVAIDYLRNEH